MDDEFSWLDGNVEASQHTGLENRAEIMRDGGQQGKDRIWWTDGEYVWFRRNKSNPETLKRHDNFVASDDYSFVETQGDVEVWQLRPQSQFASAKKTLDVTQMSQYDLRRQAALLCVKRDWRAFRDIMSFLKERIYALHAQDGHTGLADNIYAEQYLGVMNSVHQRNGPSPGEINTELMALMQNQKSNQKKLITLGA